MTEIKNLTVRPPPKLRARLEEIAQEEGISVAKVVMQLIEQGLAARDGYQDVQKELVEIKERLARLEE